MIALAAVLLVAILAGTYKAWPAPLPALPVYVPHKALSRCSERAPPHAQAIYLARRLRELQDLAGWRDVTFEALPADVWRVRVAGTEHHAEIVHTARTKAGAITRAMVSLRPEPRVTITRERHAGCAACGRGDA